MKLVTTACVLLLAAGALPARAASLESPSTGADSASIPSLGLDPAGGALFEIPATTFT